MLKYLWVLCPFNSDPLSWRLVQESGNWWLFLQETADLGDRQVRDKNEFKDNETQEIPIPAVPKFSMKKLKEAKESLKTHLGFGPGLTRLVPTMQGIGIGDMCISVMLLDDSEKDKVPKEWEGVPVELDILGGEITFH